MYDDCLAFYVIWYYFQIFSADFGQLAHFSLHFNICYKGQDNIYGGYSLSGKKIVFFYYLFYYYFFLNKIRNNRHG